ncbi:MAG: hypothetical protein KDB52_04230 [Solirubrobacterales bacterium]|nr:hypothetical protein [Solirubrobacterales bacterium]
MKQRLGIIVGVLAAFLLGTFALAGPASAVDPGTAKLQKQSNKAAKKAKSACKKAKKGNAKAKKNCKKAKKAAKKAKSKLNSYNAQFFDVCKHGCKYNTIQKGVDAAGKWKNKNKSRNATVRVQPGTYKEGVLVHGKRTGYNFKGLTIEGVTKGHLPNSNARAVILEGDGALTDMKASPNWRPGDATTQAAQNAIEGVSTVGLKMENMWARHYLNNTFFVHASNVEADKEYCADYTMDNLVSSDTRAYGLFARNCFGGKIINSEGWGHGDSTVYIGETPCDSYTWSNKDEVNEPCQAKPKWTLVKNIKAWGNPLGYSGTNSKYVKITDSMWFNNGAGIVPNTLDSEKFEPTGDLIIENNDIMWNNYNYYQPDSGYNNVIGNGNPIGVGVMLYGSDGVTVRNNNIFGHEKWGAAAFSGPDLFGVNDGDDAKNMNNQFIGNKMGRNGEDNNAIDFFNDASGGGNCWADNTASGPVTFAPGNGSVPLSTIYPGSCPQPEVLNQNVTAHNLGAGLQVNTAFLSPQEPWRDLTTIFGVAEVRPSQLQECGMTLVSHPSYTKDGKTYESQSAPRVTAQECTDLENRPSPWNP